MVTIAMPQIGIENFAENDHLSAHGVSRRLNVIAERVNERTEDPV
jgi:hypothetical protein